MSVKPTIPTLAEIRDRMNADTAYYLPGSASRPHKSLLSVLNTVFSGAIWSVYGFANWMLRQIDPLTADEAWLKIWGDKLGITRKTAIKATGPALFTGDAQTEIPAGSVVQTTDGYRYVTTSATLTPYVVKLEAEYTGYAYNLPVNQGLTLVNPITGIELQLTAGPITGGSDEETLISWANRINDKLGQMQQIGDADDYARWAKAAHTDIIDAWTYGNTPELGDITIFCLLHPAAINAEAVLVTAKAELDRTRNVAGHIFLLSPNVLPVNVRIAGAMDASTKVLINDDIKDLIISKRQRKGYLYPEEIERIISTRWHDEYTLLEPTAKMQASGDQVLNIGGITYE